jgi:4-hydroxy-3-methylbut-2-enyl diphosphate reductase IspH
MIIYEPHPVSPERKAELRAQGFKIVDAAFKSVDYVETVPDAIQAEEQAETETPPEPVPVRRGRRPKVKE